MTSVDVQALAERAKGAVDQIAGELHLHALGEIEPEPALVSIDEAVLVLRAALDGLVGELTRAQRHAGEPPSIERITKTHSSMTPDQWVEGAGHRVYSQGNGEACYLCTLLGELTRQEEAIEELRLESVARPLDTETRDTYADGYTSGLARALEIVRRREFERYRAVSSSPLVGAEPEAEDSR